MSMSVRATEAVLDMVGDDEPLLCLDPSHKRAR